MKRKLKPEEFGMLYMCFLTLHRKGFESDNSDLDEWELIAINLAKEEATDVIPFWDRDRSDKKIKREFFKKNLDTASDFHSIGNKAKAREYFRKGFVDAYTSFYGKEFIEFLYQETEIPISLIGDERIPEYISNPQNNFLLKASIEGAKERLMMSGGIRL